MPRTFLTDANPLASFTDKPVAISYLACRPHPQHVVYMGGYSDSLSQWTVLSCSASYDTCDPTLTVTLPLARLESNKVAIRLYLKLRLVPWGRFGRPKSFEKPLFGKTNHFQKRFQIKGFWYLFCFETISPFERESFRKQIGFPKAFLKWQFWN